ncbi:MAG: hypothetical protein WB729_13525 [Candidatus Sulfotelmatobacter sp.]
MLTAERHFRLVQIFCILVVLACFQVALKVDKISPEMTPIQWVVIVMGVWAIMSGFILERKIVSYPKRASRPSIRSTPLSRWRAGNLVRVASATSVALWGLILRSNGGSASVAYTLIAIGGLLLLTWRPSALPADNSPQDS